MSSLETEGCYGWDVQYLYEKTQDNAIVCLFVHNDWYRGVAQWPPNEEILLCAKALAI
jgi:hypothetical protein